MNKNKKYLIIASIAMFLVSSCNDFLEENPKNQLPPGAEFYNSHPKIQAAVNNLYRLGPNNWTSPGVYNGNRLMQGGWSSGLFDNPSYRGQELFIQNSQELTHNENNMASRMNDMFEDPYRAISRANNLLYYTDNLDLTGTGIVQANLDRFRAEARFFRAYNYLWLVRHWGDVPIVSLEPLVATDDLNSPRSAAKTIYDDYIVPDLLHAVDVLVNNSQYSNSMRITAPIASATLIDAYVQMAGYPLQDVSKWALAATEAKKFLPGGEYAALFDLEVHEDFEELSAYNKMRTVGARAALPTGRVSASSREFIYVNEHAAGLVNAGFSANAWPVQVGALGTSESRVALTNNAYMPTAWRMAVYDEDVDLRRKEKQFFASFFVRRDGTHLPHPANQIPSPYFYHDHGQITLENLSGRDFPLYRLAEMYLFAAEAIARSEGVTPQAIDALATIRARAYVFGAGDIDQQANVKAAIVAELTGLTVDRFVEEVWLERYRELVFEFKDWNLIQRTRLYPLTNPRDNTVPVASARFVDITSVTTGFSGANNFSLNHLVWPIPLPQMQRNPLLRPQNPGYEVTQL